MAYEDRKPAGAMQAIVAADGALEAKYAQESSHMPFRRYYEANKSRSERAKERQERAQMRRTAPFEAVWGAKK